MTKFYKPSDPSLEEDDVEDIEKRMYLRKDEWGDWYFSLVPFEELESRDNVVSCPGMDVDLDIVYGLLNKNENEDE
jgi:hypothetical protein